MLIISCAPVLFHLSRCNYCCLPVIIHHRSPRYPAPRLKATSSTAKLGAARGWTLIVPACQPPKQKQGELQSPVEIFCRCDVAHADMLYRATIPPRVFAGPAVFYYTWSSIWSRYRCAVPSTEAESSWIVLHVSDKNGRNHGLRSSQHM